MVRLACISLTQLALQVLLRNHPDWRDHAVVVIREAKPISPILFVNQRARGGGIKPGQKYSEALSLVPELRAAPVEASELVAAIDQITQTLQNFSPEVEPCAFDPEVIWVNVAGLTKLFTSLAAWLTSAQQALADMGFQARIVIGYSRFGTYALARTSRKSLILNTVPDETAAIAVSPITIFPLSLRTRRLLERLGIRTVQDFLNLPMDGTKRRFGDDANALLDIIRFDRQLPLQALAIREEPQFERRLDSSIFSLGLIMAEVADLVDQVLTTAAQAASQIAEVELILDYENGASLSEKLRPARATSSAVVLLRLIELRLTERRHPAGIEALRLRPQIVVLDQTQAELFSGGSRNREAGAEAFALIRARLGNAAISVARLKDAHLPEARFGWEAIVRPPVATPPDNAVATKSWPAIRRLVAGPRRLGAPVIPARTLSGPLVVAGGWWASVGSGFDREYRFYQTVQGEVWWAYHDRQTGIDYLQAVVD